MSISAWNKDRSLGQKPPLTYEQVQAIKTTLVQAGTARDRALFSLAVDSSLRSHDLLRLRVSDIMASGEVLGAVRVIPTKTRDTTGESVIFEPTHYTQKLLTELVAVEDKFSHEYLFTRAKAPPLPVAAQRHLTERAYQNLVKKWVGFIALNSELYGTHSLRRTRPAYIYHKTKNLRACQRILGHSKITTTQEYLGIGHAETLEVSRQWQM
jgi:integrase